MIHETFCFLVKHIPNRNAYTYDWISRLYRLDLQWMALWLVVIATRCPYEIGDEIEAMKYLLQLIGTQMGEI